MADTSPTPDENTEPGKSGGGFGLQDSSELGTSPLSSGGPSAQRQGMGYNSAGLTSPVKGNPGGPPTGAGQPSSGAAGAANAIKNTGSNNAPQGGVGKPKLTEKLNKASQPGGNIADKTKDKVPGSKPGAVTKKDREADEKKGGTEKLADEAAKKLADRYAPGVGGKVVEKAGGVRGVAKKAGIAAAVVAIIAAIPIFLIVYLISNPWDAVREVITNSKIREFALDVAGSFASGILEEAIETVTYTGEVEYKGPNTAIAATPSSVTPGTTLEKLTQIDWKKAQYQTLDKNNCGYTLKLKTVVNVEGRRRSIPEAVTNNRTGEQLPLNQLTQAASFCIAKQYPIFNLFARQPVTREINQLADVYLNYAAPKDSEELRGKNNKQVNKFVYDKTLARITPQANAISFEPWADVLGQIQAEYKVAVESHNAQNPSNEIPYNPERADVSAGITKMFEDMEAGTHPYDLQVNNYINIPTQDTGNSELVTSGIANTMCPFALAFFNLGDNPFSNKAVQGATNARGAVESRLGSTQRGAAKSITLADTRKADQLSNVENNATIRQLDNWASSTAYQLDVYNELRGVEQNPEASSTRAYNTQPAVLSESDEMRALKFACNEINGSRSNELVATAYQSLKRRILEQSPGVFTSVNDFGLKEIITAYMRTGSATAVSGLEDGPDNYNRQAAGFRQLMNDYYLKIGGRFLTEEEARQLAVESENARRTQEREGGLAYRLFASENTRSARSVIAHNTITPKTAMTAGGNLLKQLISPLQTLASVHSSTLYYGFGEHNKAFAISDTTPDKYLKIDTSGIPNGDFNIDMLENARFIEDIQANGSEEDKRKLTHYSECMAAKIPSTEYFVIDQNERTDDDEDARVQFVQFFVYFPEKQRSLDANQQPVNDDPDSEFNKFFNCKVLLQTGQDINNPDHALAIRYRMYTYYNTILDMMVSLSSEEDDQSIYANSASTPSGPLGAPDPNADTSGIPCPTEPGIADGGVQQTYAAGRVAQNKIRVCIVQGTDVNVSIASSLNKLFNDARAAGIDFAGSGGFRSYDEQKSLRIAHGCADDSLPSSACSPPTAPPGNSMHEKGLAIDFAQAGQGTISSGSSGFTWLQANAANYGLINLPIEAWHWSTDGS